MAEFELVELEKMQAQIENLQNTVKKIQSDMKANSIESTKVHLQYSENFRRVENNLNERFRLFDQEIAHLKGITFPEFWEMKVNEVIDKVYVLENKLLEEVSKWSKFREDKYFEAVTPEEATQFVKLSGATLKELADAVGIEMSGVSRLLNGERKKDNYVAYHKIKQVCLAKMGAKK